MISVTANITANITASIAFTNITIASSCIDATVENSDLSYSNTVASGGTLVLPNITHIDPQGNNVVLPAQTPFNSTTYKSDIAYQLPSLAGQLTSYRTGDDRYNQINNPPPTNPLYPLYYARLDYNSANPFGTLENNNIFGNKNRFTDDVGGQTYANNSVLDHYTRFEWYKVVFASVSWNNAIDNTQAATTNGHTDWCLPDRLQMVELMNIDLADVYNFAPFNLIPTTNLWTSTTSKLDTATAFIANTNSNAGRLAKTTTLGYLMCRYF